MLNVPTIEHKIVAVLHDVLEDTETSTEDLRKLGFQQQIIDAILALTKKSRRISITSGSTTVQNPIARVVRISRYR